MEWTCDPSRRAPRRLDQALGLLQGHGQLGRANGGQPVGQLAGGSAGRVRLVIVGVVDDFPLGKIAGGDFGKFLQQDHRERKISHRQDPQPAAFGDCRDLGIIGVGLARGANHNVRPVLQGGQDVGFGDLRFGEIEKDVAGMGESLWRAWHRPGNRDAARPAPPPGYAEYACGIRRIRASDRRSGRWPAPGLSRPSRLRLRDRFEWS